MAYKVAVIWTGSLDDLVDRLGATGRVVGATQYTPRTEAPTVVEPKMIQAPTQAPQFLMNNPLLTKLEQIVLRLIQQDPRRTYTHSEVARHASGQGYKATSAGTVLARLRDQRLIRRISHGEYQAI